MSVLVRGGWSRPVYVYLLLRWLDAGARVVWKLPVVALFVRGHARLVVERDFHQWAKTVVIWSSVCQPARHWERPPRSLWFSFNYGDALNDISLCSRHILLSKYLTSQNVCRTPLWSHRGDILEISENLADDLGAKSFTFRGIACLRTNWHILIQVPTNLPMSKTSCFAHARLFESQLSINIHLSNPA